jgi:hypothetical protein
MSTEVETSLTFASESEESRKKVRDVSTLLDMTKGD